MRGNLAGALLVAATNVWLVRSVTGAGAASAPTAGLRPAAVTPVIAMMPKAKGDPYS